MSKYLRMPLNYNGITCKYKDTTSPYSASNPHKGVDFGWHSYQGEPVYSVGDGTVISIGSSTGNMNAGNYVWIRHSFDNQNELISRYCHLKDGTTTVKGGQKVTKGQQIGNMGGTFGYATHLHYEMWKVPKGWAFNWNDRSKYLVNPLDYTFATADQEISSGSTQSITRLLGSPTKKDTTKNQIEVIGYKLRCRKGAGTNQTVLGYIDYGIYDYTETKESNGYTWYHISSGWIAGTKEDTKIYPAESSSSGEIEELKEEIKKLDSELLAQKTANEELSKRNEELTELLGNYSNLKEFKAPREGYYYIKLKADDIVYF